MISGESRRRQILQILEQTDVPISASALAQQFEVSRQIIVGDVALIRAQGIEIIATPRGYVLQRQRSGTIIKQIVVNHSAEDTRKELETIVDMGCRVIDVIVEHPVYGQLSGMLQISSRMDVDQFLRRVEENNAHSLSELTDGIHTHRIECPGQEVYELVLAALRERGMLVENN